MRSYLIRIAQWLLRAAGVVVIVAALAIGVFRLLVAQLPGYQAELETWVMAELGLRAGFEQVDGRWGLRGPELALRNVRIGGDAAGAAVVTAERVVVGLDAVALIVEGKPRVARLSVDGLAMTIERSAAGEYRLAGAQPGGNAGRGLGIGIPAEVAVTIRAARITYRDVARDREWTFDEVAMNLARTDSGLTMTAEAAPPPELAEHVELTLALATGTESPGDWQLHGDFRAADLAQIDALVRADDEFPLAGRGDATVRLDGTGRRVTHAAATVALTDIALPRRAGGLERAYESVALSGAWAATSSGWQLDLDDVELARNGRAWNLGSARVELETAGEAIERLHLGGDFLRLEDLTPLVLAIADAPVAEQWTQQDLRGDLRDLDFALERAADDKWDYNVAVDFDEFGFAASAGRPGIRGLRGSVRSSARSGTVELRSSGVTFDWPKLFAAPLTVDTLSGSVVWRQGRDVVRVVGHDLEVGVLGADIVSSLELSLPLDGSSPRLDMDARATRIDLAAARQGLPRNWMPRAVGNWLSTAVRAGEARDVELSFFGPLSAFPFDHGEGAFRVAADVEDVELAYAPNWPVATDVAGRIEFVNAGFAARARGRVLGSRGQGIEVSIPNMRTGEMGIAAQAEGPLSALMAFLRAAPQLAERLGPDVARLEASAGTSSVDFKLDLPLREQSAFDLAAEVTIAGGDLAIQGFAPHASEINGMLEVGRDYVRGDGIEAVFLDGPVRADVAAAAEDGYGAMLVVDGETTAGNVLDAFGLPFADRVGGQTRWRGRLLLPARGADAPAPLRIDVESNLAGVALRLPAPFAKAPGEPSNLQLEFRLAPDGLAVDGNLGATRRASLRFAKNSTGGYAFERGALQFGGSDPELPLAAGLAVRGSVPVLDVEAWLGLARAAGNAGSAPLLLGADLDLTELSAFGQQLGMSKLAIRREPEDWAVEIESEAVAGRIRIPRSLDARPQIVADMDRLYLAGGGATGDGTAVDPRSLPGIKLDAREFALGSARFGHVTASIDADPAGLKLTSFAGKAEGFVVEGSGAWLSAPTGPRTQIDASLQSTDVATTLQELGFEPFMLGETAKVTAGIAWAGPPGPRWLDHLNGTVTLSVEEGSMLEIDPGAGRVVGLLSVAALPRRLALDFRDVFNRGFAFDDITGDFSIIDGNAYTDNLKMSGPSAEVGIIGRTGLRDRDYQQQAVISAEPSNVLPTVGALFAGPGVGAAWLIFTQIFKKPLRGIGRAAYCVTGSWEAPAVERLSGERGDHTEQCADLPPDGFSASAAP